ncbi:undecaprenyldiphospho-muramoylpentapeptide beta-N-acetylglucosaminyltransferase [Caldimonas brevitalea]|uniref:UDP-N-acetylglucosamine--N-acetylmuramyl-(pentapeptide) pyrophosphoryl-undecaprenol N-acetylglucosamine transferase n=1 Tax=Caldimonas brevitalea TaxID=413882 RepID=A0A0G3BMW0_9BURK|nr:undecaprenyldiphospho-muramoylpentapeptide beta-N-acetylglucosaminyltransferase [Caldimonas brevitalea]AKJ27870.1 UDP-N-acetylglucosamine--N-acetylmuramyl-(pentapeptide) pyrophosphoryl-UDP N-acetylglucosamine transferase [Caldimonas brevitalea]
MSRHLVIVAAGTGGHIIPGLAVAQEMQRRGWTVSWLGTTQGMENRLVPAAGIPLDTIGFSGLRGKGLLHTMTGGLRLLGAFASCWRILRERKATAVLGMGGYVCFPGGLMAAARFLPLVLVNADAALLMSNRALLPVADMVAFGFDGAAATVNKRATVTGNPVRPEIEEIAPPAERFAGRTGPLRVLVVGGSLGARVLNETLPKALALLSPEQRPQVTHQTGQLNRDGVKALYAAQGIDPDREVEVLPFIDNMAERLAACDLIVCRAGAVTVSELCAAGVASVLVPLIVSTTSHQRDNAQYMAQYGAAIHLPQAELTPERLAETLRTADRAALQAMAEKARTLARPRAAAKVADEIEKLVQQKGGAA